MFFSLNNVDWHLESSLHGNEQPLYIAYLSYDLVDAGGSVFRVKRLWSETMEPPTKPSEREMSVSAGHSERVDHCIEAPLPEYKKLIDRYFYPAFPKKSLSALPTLQKSMAIIETEMTALIDSWAKKQTY